MNQISCYILFNLVLFSLEEESPNKKRGLLLTRRRDLPNTIMNVTILFVLSRYGYLYLSEPHRLYFPSTTCRIKSNDSV